MKVILPEDEYSFDALELADAINSAANECKEPVVTLWVRKPDGMIYAIKKLSIETDSDGEQEIFLDVE